MRIGPSKHFVDFPVLDRIPPFSKLKIKYCHVTSLFTWSKIYQKKKTLSLNWSLKLESHKKVVFYKCSSWHGRVKDSNVRLGKPEVFSAVTALALQRSFFSLTSSPWQLTELGRSAFQERSFMKKGQKHVTRNDMAADAACCSACLYFEVYHVSWVAKNSIRQGEGLHTLKGRQDFWWGKRLKDKCL